LTGPARQRRGIHRAAPARYCSHAASIGRDIAVDNGFREDARLNLRLLHLF